MNETVNKSINDTATKMRYLVSRSDDKESVALSFLSSSIIALSDIVGHEKASLILKAASITEAKLHK